MARSAHPKNELEQGSQACRGAGLELGRKGQSRFWEMYCPYNDKEFCCGEFSITSIWSTLKNPGNHANALQRVVDRCTTHRKSRNTDDDAKE